MWKKRFFNLKNFEFDLGFLFLLGNSDGLPDRERIIKGTYCSSIKAVYPL